MKLCIGVHGQVCENEATATNCFCDECNKKYMAACHRVRRHVEERMSRNKENMRKALDA